MSKNLLKRLIRARKPDTLFDLYSWGDDAFEEICANLLFYEPALQNPERYGRPRQEQFGVDVVADRRDGSGIDAVSCKCYKSLKKGDIRDFVDEFLEHWDSHWVNQRVRRFILCIACDTRAHERRAEIAAEKARLKALGVAFEVWGQRELSIRVRENPAVARAFFEPFDPVAPPALSSQVALSPSMQGSPLISNAGIAQIGALQSALEREVVAQLDQCQDLVRRGERAAATQTLKTIREDPTRWTSLGPTVQARLLRQQALLALNTGNLGACSNLLDEADAISADPEPRVRALLALRQSGWSAALDVLQVVTTEDGAVLRAGLLIEADRVPEAKALLHEWRRLDGKNPEWHRLTAYIACLDQNPEEGLRQMSTAELLAPQWLSIIETGAIVRYVAALSPIVRFRTGGLPEPVPAEFARQDDVSQQRLTEAAARFKSLAGKEVEARWRQRHEMWHFACLALLPQHAEEAEAACLALLRQSPLPAIAVFWALSRGYPLDIKATIRRLEKQLRDEDPSIDDLQAVIACAASTGDFKKASAALARHGTNFNEPRGKSALVEWRARIDAERARQRTPNAAQDPLQRADAVLDAAALSGDFTVVETFLSTISDRPDVIFLTCRALAGRAQWPIVAAHAGSLVKAIGTAEAVRLAAYAWYHNAEFDKACDVLRQNADLFAGGVLPAELQRLQAFAAARRGDLPSALPLATALAQRTGDSRDRLLLVDLLIHAGDVARALPLLRELLPQRTWTAEELMRWVPSVSNEEPELARSLVRMAIARDEGLHHSTILMDWSWRLGLDREANALLGKLKANKAQAEKALLREATVEEVLEHLRQRQRTRIEVNRLYAQGRGPLHVLATPVGANLAELWSHAFASGEGGFDLFIRSGNRPAEFFDPPYSAAIVDLQVDITALLTIDHLDLLDVFEAHHTSGLTLTFPHMLLPVLEVLEQQARPLQPSRMEVMETIVQQVADKKLLQWSGETLPTPDAARVSFEITADSGTTGNGITLGTLAEELARRGGAAPHEIARLRQEISGFQSSAASADPVRLQTLLFEGNTIDVVIEAGLLPGLKAQFALYIESTHHDQCLAELNSMRNGVATAKRLGALRRRLASGITSGLYRMLPEPPERASPRSSLQDALLAPLAELLNRPATERTWVWIDDRFVSSHTYANGNTIVTTFEVLDYLRNSGRLDHMRYYRTLSQLRAARVEILPIRSDEVMHQLRQARIEDGEVVETAALRDLRMSLNRLLDLEPELDLDVTQPDRNRQPGAKR